MSALRVQTLQVKEMFFPVNFSHLAHTNRDLALFIRTELYRVKIKQDVEVCFDRKLSPEHTDIHRAD